MNILLLLILVPIVAGVLVLLSRKTIPHTRESATMLIALVNLIAVIALFGQDLPYSHSWGPFKAFSLDLRYYSFSSFILIAAAGFTLLVTIYSWRFMQDRAHRSQYYGYMLLSLGFTNGAVLADNLILLLFFWEGLLGTLFGMIAIGRPGAWKTAMKAFIIVGVTDLCLMLGIILTGTMAHTFKMSEISLPVQGLGITAMLLMCVGATAKAGAMPFHSWIPDAAVDAPLPFMAFMPASLEKLLGIYLLTRITLNLYKLSPDSWVSPALMTFGCITILAAVMMALVQKDFKRLLSYHAVSQVGYMILGVGTALPIGIIGGVFHMVNHAMYKSCLFLTAGSVEKQTGTTDLAKLGGIGRLMPITFTCFIIAAMAISGVPPLNGFWSKEFVYDAALSHHVIFYLAAVLGSFFTAASFLKLGHAAFLGKRDPANDNVKEAPVSMLAPMILIAAGCILFGLWNALPLNHLVGPSTGLAAEAQEHAGFHLPSLLLATLTCVALLGALANHIIGARANGGGLHAADHIQYAPVLGSIYKKAQTDGADPYNFATRVAGYFCTAGWACDKAVDWVYDGFTVWLTRTLSFAVRASHTGSYALYVLWALVGAAAVVIYLTRIMP